MRREKLQQMLDISVVCGVKLDMKIVLCRQKVWKHPNKIETNDFREKPKNRWTSVFCWWYLFAVFDDLERVIMSSEVFLNGNVAFLPPFLIDLLIVYPTVKKIFNLHKKFPEKT
jgi:hypothetical protein